LLIALLEQLALVLLILGLALYLGKVAPGQRHALLVAHVGPAIHVVRHQRRQRKGKKRRRRG
jgi:hypothetical protein